MTFKNFYIIIIHKQIISFLGTYLTKVAKEKLKKEYKELGITSNFMNPKPIELLEFLVKQTTNENDCVLDMFAGSGKLGKVCLKLDRNIIMLQKEENDIDKVLLKRFNKFIK